MVCIRVADHVADYISNCQFGFTKGRSSHQQLLIMLDTIYTNFENKIYSNVAYLDLKKTFDSVDRHTTVYSLYHVIPCFTVVYNTLKFSIGGASIAH